MKKKVLILTSNPAYTTPLRLGEEMRRISDSLKRSNNRSQFAIVTSTATTPTHLRRAILDHKPEVVHFCGHGSGKDGISFEDELGNIKLVSTNAMTGLFELSGTYVKCVVLNACYAEIQASEIVNHIDYVIGMRYSIGDYAALNFAEGFYDALFAGETFEKSFYFGVNSLQLQDIPETSTPILKKRVYEADVKETSKKNNKFSEKKLSPNANESQNDVNKLLNTPQNLEKEKSTENINNKYELAKTEEEKLVKDVNNKKSLVNNNLIFLWLFSLLIVIAITYFMSKPSQHPLVGYYTEIEKTEKSTFDGGFFIVPEFSIISTYQDFSDGNLCQISISSNRLYYEQTVNNGKKIFIGKYNTIWKFREIKNNSNDVNKIRMEGEMLSRPGFEELRQTNIENLGIKNSDSNFKKLFQEIETGYKRGTIEIEFIDEITIKRTAVFENDNKKTRVFYFIKEKK